MERRKFVKGLLGIATLGIFGLIIGRKVITGINKSISEEYLKQYMSRSYGRVFSDEKGELLTADFRNATAVEMDILGRLKGSEIKKFLIERNIPFTIFEI